MQKNLDRQLLGLLKRRGWVLALAAALSACASNDLNLRQTEPKVAPTALGPGDVFEVRVYGENELSGQHCVSSDGSINFPLVGRVEIEGLTPSAISDLLAERLKKLIRDPHVSIFVKQFNSKKIYVLGKVEKPGTFPYEDGMTIIQAITLAGGFGNLADPDSTLVTRQINGQEQRLEVDAKAIGEGLAPNFELQPGDIVFVPETIF